MDFSQIILTPFSWLLTFFHDTFGNYGWALILFAVIVKLILFPFSLKGKRSMIQMNMIQDKVQKIQKQYANNREKMNEEVQKLYAKENVKPMSGCLWSMIPLFILWPLYAIIRRPLYHMMGQSEAAIEAISKVLGYSAETAGRSAAYSELYMANMMNEGNLEAVRAAADGISAGLGDKLFIIDFDFLGMNLADIAQWKIWDFDVYNWGTIGLFLLPIISAALSYLMTFVTQKTNNLNKQAAQQTGQMKTMMYMMPLMSLWIGYAMPAGLCVYWIINSVLSMGQEWVCGRMLKKDYEKAAAIRAERERKEKEEEKIKRREAAERRAKAIEEAKNNKGKKKKPAVEPSEKKKDRTTDVGRIGMRPYARGRAYDPDRFGGVTVYQDPGAPIDEAAVAAALASKGIEQEEAVEEETVIAPVEQAEEAVSVETAAEEVAEETAEEVSEETEEEVSEEEEQTEE